MARFYGLIKGARGQATRLGNSNSGLRTIAASWNGAVEVTVWRDDKGRDVFAVDLIPWQGKGQRRSIVATEVFGGQS